jgi:two-component system phosphate regulon sensor histidine kinase PhoR
LRQRMTMNHTETITVSPVDDKGMPMDQWQRSQDELVRALVDLNTEKKRLKTVLNCMTSGVMMTNQDQEVVLHNLAFMRLMEIHEEIQTPLPVDRIIHDESLLNTLRKIQGGACAMDESMSQEIRTGTRVLRAISAPALGPDRNVFWRITGAVTVFEDITAFKKLDQMKSDFLNMVAHELRSPLVSVRQLLHVLLEGLAGPLQEKQADFIARGTKKIDALLELINDLLNVARIEAGGYVRNRVPTDIARIIQETVSLMEPRAREQGITLTVSCVNMKPVSADPKGMEEVLSNLITNAINYSPEGGTVSITARGRGSQMEIEVSDTGVGISPEELPKIFDKFYRVKHPKTRHVTGTGLGLAIVKDVVEAHEGTIDVHSIAGKGTVFTILIPASG